MNNEKKNFIFGLVSGVAVISIIGFIVMSVAYFQKGGLKLAGSNESDQIAQDDGKDNPSPSPSPSPKSPKDIKITDSDHIRGNKKASITIVEYSDFQCSFCNRFHATMNQVMENYSNDVRWVYKHFPLDSIHPYARKAAEASECADDQGKFWEYNDKLFSNQSSINTEYLSTAAKELGLNAKTFDECLTSGKYASKVNNDFKEGQAMGVTGTPGGFINGEALGGAVPYEQLKAKIDSL